MKRDKPWKQEEITSIWRSWKKCGMELIDVFNINNFYHTWYSKAIAHHWPLPRIHASNDVSRIHHWPSWGKHATMEIVSARIYGTWPITTLNHGDNSPPYLICLRTPKWNWVVIAHSIASINIKYHAPPSTLLIPHSSYAFYDRKSSKESLSIVKWPHALRS